MKQADGASGTLPLVATTPGGGSTSMLARGKAQPPAAAPAAGAGAASRAQPMFLSVVSCVLYACCSVAMTLANKYIAGTGMSSSDAPFSLILAFQSCWAVVLVEAARRAGFVTYPSFQMSVAQMWLPVNLYFVTMLFTSVMSLRYVPIPLVVVFKNTTNILIVYGEFLLYHQRVTPRIVLSFVVILAGAGLAATSDMEFNATGYAWMFANILSSAGYALYLRKATQSVRLNTWGMLYYNNVLTVALLLPIGAFKGEIDTAITLFSNRHFVLTNVFAGCLGFFLNSSALWCVKTTSATTYAFVGAINKVPIAVLGYLLFHTKITAAGGGFVALSLLGGFMYVHAKLDMATGGGGTAAGAMTMPTASSAPSSDTSAVPAATRASTPTATTATAASAIATAATLATPSGAGTATGPPAAASDRQLLKQQDRIASTPSSGTSALNVIRAAGTPGSTAAPFVSPSTALSGAGVSGRGLPGAGGGALRTQTHHD